jgi:hypothetical protein
MMPNRNRDHEAVHGRFATELAIHDTRVGYPQLVDSAMVLLQNEDALRGPGIPQGNNASFRNDANNYVIPAI